MATSTPTRPQLERSKLAVEIIKLDAERRKAEVEADLAERRRGEHLASSDYHRVYHFVGVVKETTAQNCITCLDMWHRRDPGEPIEIIFNSPGGSVIDGLALYDYIMDLRRAGTTVETVARGWAASMGGILLQAGDRRVIGQNCHMLIHEASTGSIGKVSEVEDDLEFSKKLQRRCVAILAERSTLTERQIKRRWTRKDWWLSADEVVKFGFADEVR